MLLTTTEKRVHFDKKKKPQLSLLTQVNQDVPYVAHMVLKLAEIQLASPIITVLVYLALSGLTFYNMCWTQKNSLRHTKRIV